MSIDLTTAITALRIAGYTITPASTTHWRLQFGQGPQAIDQILSADDLLAFVARWSQPAPPSATTLDLAQIIALVRAAGMTVNPVGPGVWQVVTQLEGRTLAERFQAADLQALGAIIAATVPWLVGSGEPTPDQAAIRQRRADPQLLAYTLARLGRATTADLAQLNTYDPQRVAVTLNQMRRAQQVVAGPQNTWALTAVGWRLITGMLPAGVTVPAPDALPPPALANIVARLIADLRPLQLQRLDLTYPDRAAGSLPGPTALLTATSEPRGITWSRNLAAQIATTTAFAVTFAITVLEDRPTTPDDLALLVPYWIGTPNVRVLPCLVAADANAMAAVQAVAARALPVGPWAFSSIADAQVGQWATLPSGQFALDLMLAVRAAQN